MHVILNDICFNMDRYDYVRKLDGKGKFVNRISFFINGVETNSAYFDSKEEMQKEWERIKEMVNTWYSSSTDSES